MSKFAILQELWQFLKTNKRWWLLPIAALLLILSGVIFLAQSSVVGPFIYTLF